MESVGDVIKRQTSRFQYQDLVQQIMKDPDVAAFIQKESLSPEELNRVDTHKPNRKSARLFADLGKRTVSKFFTNADSDTLNVGLYPLP